DAGQVWFGGHAITGLAPDKVFAAGIGRTFQLPRIFPRLTVIENMLIAAQTKDRPRNLLAWFGRDAWSHHRRHALELLEFVGINRHADVLAGSLSYGQRKLLELAYVLVADPAVILLDEPAGGGNPTLINLIADRIRLLNAEQGKTFLLVEHNMEFVMGLCSVITVLESGAAVVSGPPEIVRTDKRVLDAYLGADLDEETVLVEEEGRCARRCLPWTGSWRVTVAATCCAVSPSGYRRAPSPAWWARTAQASPRSCG